MADLQLRHRWEPWAPKLDGNDELEKPFFFELVCGLSRAEMRKLDDDMRRVLGEKTKVASDTMPEAEKSATPEQRREWFEQLAEKLLAAEIDAVNEVLGPLIRMGTEPLTVAGKPITSFREYLEVVAQVSDQAALMEPLRAVRAANSLNGEQVLFSARRSGGSTTTPSRGAASKAAKTGGH